MYRFLLRPTWLLFHAAVLAGVILMTAAGFWQLNRLDERKDFNSEVRGRSQQAPLELTSVLDEIEAGTLDESSAEWLPVTATGTYLPDQVLEFNNSQGGRAGDNVVTALVLYDELNGENGLRNRQPGVSPPRRRRPRTAARRGRDRRLHSPLRGA